MGGSGSRSAQELHRSPPCTRLQCLDPTRRQPRTAVGLPKCRHGPLKALPQQQCRRIMVQKNAAPQKGEVAVGRLRAGCESFRGYGDVTAQVAHVRPQEELGRHRCLQHSDGSFPWKTNSGVISEMAHLTTVKQSADKPSPLPRPRPPRQPQAPQAAPGAGRAAGRFPAAARRPPAPPSEPPPPAVAHRPHAGPQLRVCREVSGSYAGSSTSSRSSLARGDSGISSSPSRVSLESRHSECEGEKWAKPRSPRPPAWKVRGVREDQIPNDLHRRFCEEIKSRYQLQTEEDRRRRLLAIERMDAMVSERIASSVGREIPAPHRRLRRRPKRCWATSGDKGGDRSNSSELRSLLSSSPAEGKSGNSEGRKSIHSARDDIKPTLTRVPLDQYPKYLISNTYKDRLQQKAEKNHYRSLNGANFRQLPENYSVENSQEQRHMCDTFSKKLIVKTYETEKDHAHRSNTCLNHIKQKRTDAGIGGMHNEWGNTFGDTEFVKRTADVSETQTMMNKGKRHEQNKTDRAIVRDWYGEEEGLHKQEQNETDSLLVQAGQGDHNVNEDLGTETQQCDPQQSDSRNAGEGNVSAESSTVSDYGGRAPLRKDNVVMQLLLGGYFRHEHSPPCWPRVGDLRRTSNQLDLSIGNCRDAVQTQSVETQTLPVHVSRRLTHVDHPRLQFTPKIEIDHRGERTRYYGLGREGSVGSVLSTGTPASPQRPQAHARLLDEDRPPSYLVLEGSPPPPGCGPQRSHSDLSSHRPGPSAQWISPDTAFTSSHNNRHPSMAPSLARHMSGNSTNSRSTGALTLKPEPEVSSGSHHRNTTSKSTATRSSCDQSNEDDLAVEHNQGKKSAWVGQILPISHSTLHELSVNDVRIKTNQPFCRDKNNAEPTNVRHQYELPVENLLTSEEELSSVSLSASNQYNCRLPLDDTPEFSRVGEGRSVQYPNTNAHGNEIHHRIDHCWKDGMKQKPENHSDQNYHKKNGGRFAPRHFRHSRHRRNSSGRTRQEDKVVEPDSGSEETIVQPNIQSFQRVIEKTDLSNSCREKDSFDNLDNVLLADVRLDCKGDGKSHFKHNARTKRIIQDEREEETNDDAHVRIGSTERSSDSITKSCTSLLCHCHREQAQATSFEQCNVRKFIPDRKKIEKRDSRRSTDRSRSSATLQKPSAAVVRNADCRVKQESPYEHNDLHDEDITHCRSSCCCTCHKRLRRPRFEPDVSGQQATRVAKRAQCSGAASTSETPCCCQNQQSVQCEAGSRGLCSACLREMRSGNDEPASEKRNFRECYCGSRRVCYSILEDEEEAATAEEAKGSGCGFVHALSFFQTRSSGEWSQ